MLADQKASSEKTKYSHIFGVALMKGTKIVFADICFFVSTLL